MQNATPLVSRRNVLTGIIAAPTLAAAAGATLAHAENIDAAAARAKAALKSAKGTKLVLLGTGSGPIPGLARRMASNLMVHNEAAYVLDCGLGVTDQYARTGIPFSALRSIFVTHHHPDHNIEYGPLLVIGWTSGMRQAVRAYGPPPLMKMTADYFRSVKPTIDFWAEDFHIPPLQMIEVQEISNSGPVMQDHNVKVTSALVQHPPAGLNIIATRVTAGAISLSNPSHLPANDGSCMRKPVIFPPGRGRPSTKPEGSATFENTIGIVRVSLWSAAVTEVECATITSG
jgi:Metallo-beta-lactamase superfamily